MCGFLLTFGYVNYILRVSLQPTHGASTMTTTTLRIDGYVTLTATDGESIRLHTNLSGMDTGWAIIDNPYFFGAEDWRIKDGDTVIGVPASHPRAMRVADAYQEFHRQMAEERLALDMYLAECEAERAAYDEAWAIEMREQEWEDKYGWMYEVQEKLST